MSNSVRLFRIVFVSVSSVACAAAFSGCGLSKVAHAAQTHSKAAKNVASATSKDSNQKPIEQGKIRLENLHAAVAKFGRKHDGQWPPLDNKSGNLMFPAKGMYPDYVTDPRLLVNPANRKAAAKVANLPVNGKNLSAFWHNGSYWYLGYAMTDEKEGMAFVNAYKKALKSGHVPAGNLKVSEGQGDGGGDTIYPLREGVAGRFVQDPNNPAATSVSQDQIPVMISRPVDGGGNVLYMDGHVKFLRYPGKFPMTKPFIKALKSLDNTPAA